MTNYEKYREEIIDILSKGDTNQLAVLKNGRPVTCLGTDCENCQFELADVTIDASDYCNRQYPEKVKAWLNAEYVEPPPKLTKAERAFCESLVPGCCIVRNVTGGLYVYTEKPVKSGMSWSLPGAKHTCCTNIGAIHNVSFPFIRWKDEQPWKVEDLLKLEVLDEKGED